MYSLSQFSFVLGLIALVGGGALYLLNALGGRALQLAATNGRSGLAVPTTSALAAASGRFGTILTVNSFIFLTACLGFRWAAAGYGPFSNMYEFSVAFAWAAVGIYLYFELRYGLRILALFVLPTAVALLLYAAAVPSEIKPLVPALQNDVLLTLHVAVAVAAYGAFAVAFGAAVLYLIQEVAHLSWLPKLSTLD